MRVSEGGGGLRERGVCERERGVWERERVERRLRRMHLSGGVVPQTLRPSEQGVDLIFSRSCCRVQGVPR